MTIAFYILSAVAVIGALLAIRLRNLVHATLSLMLFFTALAGVFVLLMAEFIAAVQILVYVGAVGILVLFAIMLTQHVTGTRGGIDSRGAGWGLAAAVAVLFAVLLPGIVISSLPSQPTVEKLAPSVVDLGHVLMAPYSIALQIMGLLLTAALIGAVVVASTPTKEEEKTN